MADIRINKKTYTGVSEVRVPLADDSGNAKFVAPQDTSWFEQVFKLVGTYPIEDLGDAGDNGVAPYRVVGGTAVADVQAKMEELGIGGAYKYAMVFIAPTKFDSSQESLVAAAWRYKADNNVVENVSGAKGFYLIHPANNQYVSTIAVKCCDYTMFGKITAIDNTKLPLNDVASCACNATEARVYLIDTPLA